MGERSSPLGGGGWQTGLQTHQAVNSRRREVMARELPRDKEEAALLPEACKPEPHGPKPSMCGSKCIIRTQDLIRDKHIQCKSP